MPTVETPLPLDKAAHFLLYGLLGVLVALGWRWSDRSPAILWPLLVAIAVGATDEMHQRSVPGRSSDVVDWFADVAGIVTACALVVRFVKDPRNAD